MIPAWKIEGESVEEILIDEEMINSEIPLVLIQNHTNKPVISKRTGENIWQNNSQNENSGVNRSSNITVVWDDYQIKKGYRYEKTGKSDLKFQLVLYKPEKPYWDEEWDEIVRKAFNVDSRPNKLIRRITKGEIKDSKLFTDDKIFVENHPMEIYTVSNSKYYIVVYQHDWWASKKAVQSCISNDLQIRVRMKYSNEWYYVDYCEFSAKGSVVGDSFTTQNNKCQLTLKRTQ